ncbi:hypothetical protein [Streptomyces sp. NPDC000410]|uniref:hypothetical protein n=1 Tax=Streptomyces sp. NPDC000410 TaxID=3154254 RepID=UPI00332D9BC8
MEAELAALAASGATVLVESMVTDAWTGLKTRVVALFRRSGGEVGDELDAARDELTSGEQDPAELETEWKVRLRRALAQDPEAVAELRAIVEEFGGPAATYAGDHIEIHGNTFHGAFQAKGTQINR